MCPKNKDSFIINYICNIKKNNQMKNTIIQIWQNAKSIIAVYRQMHKISFTIHCFLLLICFAVIILYKVHILKDNFFTTIFIVIPAILYQFFILSYVYIKATKIGKSMFQFLLLLIGIVGAITYIYCFKEILAPLSITFEEFCAFTAAISTFGAFITATNNANKAEKRAEKAENRYINDSNRDLFFRLLELYQRQTDIFSYKEQKGINAFKEYSLKANEYLALYIALNKLIEIDVNKYMYLETVSNKEKECVLNLYKEIKVEFKDEPIFDDDEIEVIPNNHTLKKMIKRIIKNNYNITNCRDAFYSRIWCDYIIQTKNNNELYNSINYIANLVYEKNSYFTGQYFRNINCLMEMIQSFEEKEKYAVIFKAQLSRYELLLLFFLTFSNQSNGSVNHYIDEYGIFDNLCHKDIVIFSFKRNETFRDLIQELLKEQSNETIDKK